MKQGGSLLSVDDAGLRTPAASRPRPIVRERVDYVPNAPVEAFIVPLLRKWVQAALARRVEAGSGPATCLDVGCGGQPFRRHIEELGFKYVGLDVVQNPEGSVDWVCEIDRPLPEDLGCDRFQLILCVEVLEHVADWAPAWSNLARLLAPGGWLIVTCPHFYILHEEPYDFWRPTVHALSWFGEANGLRVEELAQGGDAWAVLGTLLAATTPKPARAGLASRAASAVVRRAFRWGCQVVQRGWIQRLLLLEGKTYLSNLAVFSKAPPERTMAP